MYVFFHTGYRGGEGGGGGGGVKTMTNDNLSRQPRILHDLETFLFGTSWDAIQNLSKIHSITQETF